MARSFGKKNTVNRDLFSYNIMLLGEAGAGKTSMMAEVMRKFCKEDEYLMLQVGKEEGCKAINGLMWEQINTWKEFVAFVDEVVKNREDWGTLKCVTIDTIDQLIDICTPHVIKLWNSSQMGKKDFTPAQTLNQAWGGFGKADEYMMGLILDQIWKLKSVNVSVFIVGHTRRRENVDPVSGLTFSTMSAAISLKNFEALKTKMDIVSIAYVDREMVSRDFGKENIVTKKQNKINEVTNEARKVAFRSSAYVLDSKSRFPDIVDEVPMNATAFVEAIQAAIDMAAEKGVDLETTSTKAAPRNRSGELFEEHCMKFCPTAPIEEDDDLSSIAPDNDIPFDTEDDIFDDEPEKVEPKLIKLDAARLGAIREAFRSADANSKKSVKGYLANYGGKLVDEMLEADVVSIETLLQI